MNRREFVKALAGLLGLLVRALERPEPTLAKAYIKDLADAGSQQVTIDGAGFEAAYAELRAGAETHAPYEDAACTTTNVEPAGPLTFDILTKAQSSYDWMKFEVDGNANYIRVYDEPHWDGKEWADTLTRWSNDITNAAAQRVDDEIMNT